MRILNKAKINTIITISFLFVIISFFGCKELEKLTQFNMKYTESVVIPSSTGIDLPIDLSTPAISSNSESTFASNNTSKDLIEKIQLTDLELELTSPSGSDFSFLNDIEIYINASGVSETLIAWKHDIPDTQGTTLPLETTGVDLKDYIKQDNFSLRLKIVTDKLIAQDHHIDMNSIFRVDAKILGL